ncbi:MAG: hypothetical protein AB7G37_14470 [Solirubrobacteraceae bacterium]
MARLSNRQRVWRNRLETTLRLTSPVLDLVVGSVERLGRIGAAAESAVTRHAPRVGVIRRTRPVDRTVR